MKNTTNPFRLGQTVRGVRAGRFVILAFRNVADDPMIQIKPIDDEGEWLRGEFALPYDAIVAE